ncbi:GAP family protein [Streptomyces mirabilis]|uniref:GAP family protein n=1 Tax=Streptomyces mirabilis TaxID=68239 RepID=UPI003243558B
MAAIDRLTPVKVFGLGLALALSLAALNAKNAPLTNAAAASVGSAGLPVGQEITSLAIFVLIAILGLLAPLGVYMVGGGASEDHTRQLERLASSAQRRRDGGPVLRRRAETAR